MCVCMWGAHTQYSPYYYRSKPLSRTRREETKELRSQGMFERVCMHKHKAKQHTPTSSHTHTLSQLLTLLLTEALLATTAAALYLVMLACCGYVYGCALSGVCVCVRVCACVCAQTYNQTQQPTHPSSSINHPFSYRSSAPLFAAAATLN